MKYILSKTGLDIVNQLDQEQTLCAFDFDGTLSSIVECAGLFRGLKNSSICHLFT
jgi:hypothetical protein